VGLVAVVAFAAAGCSASAPDVPPPSNMDPTQPDVGGGKEDGPGDGWVGVGYGVEFQEVNTGTAIVIAYGGYSAHLAYSAGWANELVDAKLGGEGVGRIYAVQGPRDAGYDAKEIGNSKLRAHLRTIDDGTSPIFIVAHSSGTYVAHELLDQLYAAGQTSVLSRISYWNLDGGGSGLTDDIVASLHGITFTYAHDPSAGYSENNATSRALAEEYGTTPFEVTVSHTGCNTGAGWCLHDVLITHRPHNPSTYDLADDYTDFTNRPVTIEYF
jgi:hypothetical protein